jgi:hypothetical protein
LLIFHDASPDQPISGRHNAIYETGRRPPGGIDDVGYVPEDRIVMEIQPVVRLCRFNRLFRN